MRAERGPLRNTVVTVDHMRSLDDDDNDDDGGDDDDADDDTNQSAPVHRTFFPETWLWLLERMRSLHCD